MNLASSSPRTTPRRRGIAAVVLALSALWAAPCHAALVTHSFSFTASGFIPLRGPDAAPVNPVSGMVTVTFDPSVSRFNQTTGVVLNSLNLPAPESDIGFNYRADLDQLIVGGIFVDVDGLLSGDDFSFVIGGAASSSPTFVQFAYTLADRLPHVWSSTFGSVTRDGDPVPDPGPTNNVPEPTTLALALTAALAAGLRRKRGRVGGATPAQAR